MSNLPYNLAAALSAGKLVVGDYTIILTQDGPGGTLTVTRGNETQTINIEGIDDFFVIKLGVNGSGLGHIYTVDEIRAAAKSGKVLIMLGADGDVYTYIGDWDTHTHYGVCPTFIAADEYIQGVGIKSRHFVVVEDYKVAEFYVNPMRTPNPQKLIFTGAASAEYDGSRALTVHIPNGSGSGGDLPSGGTPNQQLVTDADGNATWEDRTHWSESSEAYLLPEYTALVNPAESMAFILQALELQPEAGKTYTVNWNGTDYQVAAKTYPFSIDENTTVDCVAFGNWVVEGGEDTGEPFAIMIFHPAIVATMDAFGAAKILDGSTEVTLSIRGITEKVHQLDPKYIPLVSGQDAITLTMQNVGQITFVSDTPFETVWSLTDAEIQSRMVVKGSKNSTKSVYGVSKELMFDVMQSITFHYTPYDDTGEMYVEYMVTWIKYENREYFQTYNFTRYKDTVGGGTGMRLDNNGARVLAPMTGTDIGGAIKGNTLKMTGETLDVADFVLRADTAMALTPEQQARARANIGAAATGDTPVASSTIALADTVTGQHYTLSVADGKLQMTAATDTAAALTEVNESIVMTDTITGAAYNLCVAEGKLTMTEVDANGN